MRSARHCTAVNPYSGSAGPGGSERCYDRIYAIGDIHGRFDLLQTALQKIRSDSAARIDAPTTIVLLGDVIDRGLQSRQILTLVRRLQERSMSFVMLKGNHETLLVESARGNASAQNVWLRCGGLATLESYAIDPLRFGERSVADRAATLVETIGSDVLQWLDSLPYSYRSGDYYFSHAGIDPAVELGRQKAEVLSNGCGGFYTSKADHGAVVVHGHCEVLEPEIRFNRINIDTAAHASGRLSILGLHGQSRWIIKAEGPSVQTTAKRLHLS